MAVRREFLTELRDATTDHLATLAHSREESRACVRERFLREEFSEEVTCLSNDCIELQAENRRLILRSQQYLGESVAFAEVSARTEGNYRMARSELHCALRGETFDAALHLGVGTAPRSPQ